MDWGSCVQGPNQVATLACIPTVFNNLVGWLLGLAGLAAVFFIIFSGFKFLTSGGDPKQVEGARKTMTYAIIGLVIIIFAYSIIQIIGAITGATCITFFGTQGFGACPAQ